MRHLLATTVITLLAIGTGCAWISPSSEGTSDGIQVHGHWTVTVTNPDGTLDAVHEFDNELNSAGKNVLRALLGGDSKIDGHFIKPSIQGGPFNQMGPPFACQEAIIENFATGRLLEATATTDISIPDPPLTLTAVCTISEVEEGSEIRSVSTLLRIDSQAQYHTKNGVIGSFSNYKQSNFTWHKFAEDKFIPVALNQKYSFNVVISFN